MLCQQHWLLVPSLFLIIFSFWCFFPKSLLLTFHSGVPLKSWPLVLLPSRSLTFFKFNFWLPFLLSFFPMSWFLLARLKVFPATSFHGSSFWLPWGTSPLFMNCWFPGFLVPFCIIGWLIGTYLFSFPVFSWHSFWVVLISSWLCYMSRGSRAPGNPSVSRPSSYHWTP